MIHSAGWKVNQGVGEGLGEQKVNLAVRWGGTPKTPLRFSLGWGGGRCSCLKPPSSYIDTLNSFNTFIKWHFIVLEKQWVYYRKILRNAFDVQKKLCIRK
jgi:hypothetical protein